MKIKHKVWFNKTSAVLWILAGLAAFKFGWQNAVWFLLIVSVYANVKADWSTAEAADNRELMETLKRIEEKLNLLLEKPNHDE